MLGCEDWRRQTKLGTTTTTMTTTITTRITTAAGTAERQVKRQRKMGGVGALARLLPASSICSPSHTRQFAREMLYIFSAASPSAARFSHQTKRMKSSVHITLSFFIMQTQKRIEMITHQLSKHRRSVGASCVIRPAANHSALLVPRILILR